MSEINTARPRIPSPLTAGIASSHRTLPNTCTTISIVHNLQKQMQVKWKKKARTEKVMDWWTVRGPAKYPDKMGWRCRDCRWLVTTEELYLNVLLW